MRADMLNMDISRRVVIDTVQADWVKSPIPGVWRKPLAREEAERGHATSIVRYDAGARFSTHDHPLGEEILVLSGTFSDETGDFPAGTYFRNPPGFRHAPFSEPGCLILVKLHQFQPDDSAHICIDTNTATWRPGSPEMLALHQHGTETVALLRFSAGASVPRHQHPAGEELYIISGRLSDDSGSYSAGTWIRNPPGSAHSIQAEEDTVAWIKAGHLG